MPELDRRDFLKVAGLTAGAAATAACQDPVEKVIPYLVQPEEIVPGKPLHYASGLTLGGYGVGVLVESHMGRPTKIEGNPDSSSGCRRPRGGASSSSEGSRPVRSTR